MLSAKDTIELNRSFSTGVVVNAGSLDYAVKTQARSRNWLRTAAVFARTILLDHVFEDGNKRTAAAVLMLLMDMNHVAYHPGAMPKIVLKIIKQNMTSITEIERCVRDAIR